MLMKRKCMNIQKISPAENQIRNLGHSMHGQGIFLLYIIRGSSSLWTLSYNIYCVVNFFCWPKLT